LDPRIDAVAVAEQVTIKADRVVLRMIPNRHAAGLRLFVRPRLLLRFGFFLVARILLRF
jgi:hypothetical protein